MGECAFFKEERKIYIEKLETSPILSDQYIQSLRNPEFLTQLTLDATVISGLEECDSEGLGSLELCTIYLLILSRSISDHHLRCGVGG